MTIVWPLAGTAKGTVTPESGWKNLPSLVQELAGASYTPLPALSYHVTVLSIFTENKTKTPKWLQYIQNRAPRLKRAQEVLDDPMIGCTPKKMKFLGVRFDGRVIVCEFEIADDEEKKKCKEQEKKLVEILGVEPRSMYYHLTLAYRFPGAQVLTGTEDIEEKLTNKVAEYLENNDMFLPLDKADVNQFESMEAFPIWNSAGVSSENFESVPKFTPVDE